MITRSRTAVVTAALVVASVGAASPARGAGPAPTLPAGEPSVVDLQAQGASPLPTDKTIPHWRGSFTDPTNGVTYGFNMPGSDPALLQDTTIHVDIVPLNFVFGSYGLTFNGSDVIPNLLASPIFQPNDYSTTPAVTSAADASGHSEFVPGGELSAGNSGVQFLDAYMRAQFNKVGTSYHLRLAPTVLPARTINVPQGMGTVYRNPRGVVWAAQAVGSSFATSLSPKLDPTHLLLLVTNNVFVGSAQHCCALGFHAASRSLGGGHGDVANQGTAAVPTWIYAAYLQPGTINPAVAPGDRDVTVFDHELAEWADDPFADNTINNWLSPLPPQSGCGDIVEVGDPVDRVAFTMPGNTFDTGPYADGNWHLQDDMFLPWYARQVPNTTSQPTQTPSADVGRYSFMGDLNPYAYFHQPAQSC